MERKRQNARLMRECQSCVCHRGRLFVRLELVSRSVTYMHDVEGVSQDDEENSVSATGALAKEQLTDRFSQRHAFGRQETAMGILCERLDAVTYRFDPSTCGGRRILTNMTVSLKQILL